MRQSWQSILPVYGAGLFLDTKISSQTLRPQLTHIYQADLEGDRLVNFESQPN